MGSPQWPESETEVIILRSGVDLNHDRLVNMSSLKAVIRAGSGTDNIDIELLASRAIPLVTIKGLNCTAVAELTFGLFLDLARRITALDGLLRKGRWSKHDYLGTELNGKTLGILGVGNIGSRVAQMGLAWGMNVIGTIKSSPSGRVETFAKNGVEIVNSRLAIADKSDFISVHLPLTNETEGMIDATFFSRMKKTAYLVNVARGGVVDADALYTALAERGIAGAGLDVHMEETGESRFSKFENVVLTPHIGSCTAETQEQIGQAVLAAVESVE